MKVANSNLTQNSKTHIINKLKLNYKDSLKNVNKQTIKQNSNNIPNLTCYEKIGLTNDKYISKPTQQK